MLRMETLDEVEPNLFEEPEGEIIEVYQKGRHGLSVLTRVSERDEGGAEELLNENGEPTCGYETDNGPCERIVDSVEERCWQHD